MIGKFEINTNIQTAKQSAVLNCTLYFSNIQIIFPFIHLINIDVPDSVERLPSGILSAVS